MAESGRPTGSSISIYEVADSDRDPTLMGRPERGYYDIVGVLNSIVMPRFLSFLFQMQPENIVWADEGVLFDVRKHHLNREGKTGDFAHALGLPFVGFYSTSDSDYETTWRGRRNHSAFSRGVQEDNFPVPLRFLPMAIPYRVHFVSGANYHSRYGVHSFGSSRSEDDRILVQFKITYMEGDKETSVDFCLPVNFDLRKSNRSTTQKQFLYEQGIIVNTFEITAHTFEIRHDRWADLEVGTFKKFEINIVSPVDSDVVLASHEFPVVTE